MLAFCDSGREKVLQHRGKCFLRRRMSVPTDNTDSPAPESVPVLGAADAVKSGAIRVQLGVMALHMCQIDEYRTSKQSSKLRDLLPGHALCKLGRVRHLMKKGHGASLARKAGST